MIKITNMDHTTAVDSKLFDMILPFLNGEEYTTYYHYSLVGEHTYLGENKTRVEMTPGSWRRLQYFRQDMINKYFHKLKCQTIEISAKFNGVDFTIVCTGDEKTENTNQLYKEKM